MAKKQDAATDDSARPFTGEVNPSVGLTIDERMANLHADHVAMGARPADDSAPADPGTIAQQPGHFARVLDERDAAGGPERDSAPEGAAEK